MGRTFDHCTFPPRNALTSASSIDNNYIKLLIHCFIQNIDFVNCECRVYFAVSSGQNKSNSLELYLNYVLFSG